MNDKAGFERTGMDNIPDCHGEKQGWKEKCLAQGHTPDRQKYKNRATLLT